MLIYIYEIYKNIWYVLAVNIMRDTIPCYEFVYYGTLFGI